VIKVARKFGAMQQVNVVVDDAISWWGISRGSIHALHPDDVVAHMIAPKNGVRNVADNWYDDGHIVPEAEDFPIVVQYESFRTAKVLAVPAEKQPLVNEVVAALRVLLATHGVDSKHMFKPIVVTEASSERFGLVQCSSVWKSPTFKCRFELYVTGDDNNCWPEGPISLPCIARMRVDAPVSVLDLAIEVASLGIGPINYQYASCDVCPTGRRGDLRITSTDGYLDIASIRARNLSKAACLRAMRLLTRNNIPWSEQPRRRIAKRVQGRSARRRLDSADGGENEAEDNDLPGGVAEVEEEDEDENQFEKKQAWVRDVTGEDSLDEFGEAFGVSAIAPARKPTVGKKEVDGPPGICVEAFVPVGGASSSSSSSSGGPPPIPVADVQIGGSSSSGSGSGHPAPLVPPALLVPPGLDDDLLLSVLMPAPIPVEPMPDVCVSRDKHLIVFTIEALGSIRVNTHKKQFDAHCSCLGQETAPGIFNQDHRTAKTPVCTLNRMAAKKPLGFLLAWLRLGPIYTSRADHLDISKFEGFITISERRNAREWLETHAPELVEIEAAWNEVETVIEPDVFR
jgi:hypothetical protein